MKQIKPYLPLLALLLLSFISYREWLSFDILSSGDYHYYFHESLSAYLPVSIWNSRIGLGSVDILLWRTPLQVLWGLFGRLGFDYNVADRFVTLWPWIILPAVSIYFFLRKLFSSYGAILAGSFVFMLNTYYLSISTQGQLLLSIAGSFAILAILFFILSLESKKKTYILLTALTLFLTASYDLRILYITLIVLFFYYVFYLFSVKTFEVKKVIIASITAAVPVILFLFLSLYWALPMVKSASFSGNAILSRQLFGNEFLNINYAFTLFHPFWTGQVPAWFEVQRIPVYFWLIPFFAILGLFFQRKNKYVLFFGFIALLGIFLTKQVSIPFQWIYPLLFSHLPGFNAFREASKFYFLIIIGYSVLIASFVEFLIRQRYEEKWKDYAKYLLVLVIMVLFLWNIKPLVTGEIGSLFVAKSINNEYQVVRDMISKQDEYFRVLWIPVNPRWHFDTDLHPEIGTVTSLTGGEWKKFIPSGKKPEYYPEGEMAIDFFGQSTTDGLLDSSSVKYIVVPLSDNRNDDNVFQFYGKPRQYYINQLNKLSYLKKINIGTKEIVVYENEGYRPHIYLSSGSLVLDGRYSENSFPRSNTQNPTSNYQFISPTEYKVKLSHIKNPVYLQFAESYHPQWKLRVGEFHWWEVLLDKNYFLPASIHSKNDAQLNQYKIDPSAICKTFTCTKNEDGSYDIEMTLYFAPQSYMYLGGIISLTTLLGIIGYLGYVGVRAINNNQRAKKSDKRR